jgi:hypothetical protein
MQQAQAFRFFGFTQIKLTYLLLIGSGRNLAHIHSPEFVLDILSSSFSELYGCALG